MSEIEFTSTMTVELVDSMGDDLSVARAARVSTLGDTAEHSQVSNAGLIGYLMKNRHGSPFEHTSMTFRIEAPIFVFREFMRHRIGWSYNEVSARYSAIPPKFYVYSAERPLVQEGKSDLFALTRFGRGRACEGVAADCSLKTEYSCFRV